MLLSLLTDEVRESSGFEGVRRVVTVLSLDFAPPKPLPQVASVWDPSLHSHYQVDAFIKTVLCIRQWLSIPLGERTSLHQRLPLSASVASVLTL